jgi:hypothetical protein
MTAATRTTARGNRRQAAQHGGIGIAPVGAARSRLTILFPAGRQNEVRDREVAMTPAEARRLADALTRAAGEVDDA